MYWMPETLMLATTGRRSFLKACGVGAALLPLPAVPGPDHKEPPNLKLNYLSAFVDIESEFNIRGDGKNDDTAGWRALAEYASTDSTKVFRARFGSVYLIDAAENIVFPPGVQIELLNSRFLRTTSLSRSNRIFHFEAGCRCRDRLHLELGEGVTYRRLIRFTDGCFFPEIELRAATRGQLVTSPNDHALTWVGQKGTESMRGAGFGLLRADNIDCLTQFFRPASGPEDPTPARDVVIGDARTTNCGMITWLRNCADVSVGDLFNSGAPVGGATAMDTYVLLMEGVQNAHINSARGVETLTHVVRNSGPRTGDELSDRNIQIGSISSIRGHRTAYKAQPGLEGQRVSEVQIGQIMAVDSGFDRDEGTIPESNEEIVRIDCGDGIQVGRILGRASNRKYSCFDGLVIANSKNVTVGSYDVDNPFRHHISFLNYTQGGLSEGPVIDCRIAYARGSRSSDRNQDANVLLDCGTANFENIGINDFTFRGGADVFAVRGAKGVIPSVFEGTANGFSGLPVNFSAHGTWGSRENLIFADSTKANLRGFSLNSDFSYAPRGAGPFSEGGLALGHGRLQNGEGSINSITQVEGLTAATALSWARFERGLSPSFYNCRLGLEAATLEEWLTVVFTAYGAHERMTASVSLVRYDGTSHAAQPVATPVRVALTKDPKEFCIPYRVRSSAPRTGGHMGWLALNFIRNVEDENGTIIIENADAYRTPFPPPFLSQGLTSEAVAAAIPEF
jgi:hypothetical protein